MAINLADLAGSPLHMVPLERYFACDARRQQAQKEVELQCTTREKRAVGAGGGGGAESQGEHLQAPS